MSVVKLPSKRQTTFRPVHEAVCELNDIAIMRGAKQHLVTAIVEVKRAIAVAPGAKELWNNLATLFWKLREYDEAMACIERALKIDPGYYKVFHNKALVLEDMRRFDEAEVYFQKALDAEPDYFDPKWGRSMMRLSLGDYLRGFDEYEIRIPFRMSEGKNVYPKFPAPYWNGENVKGKKLFCCIEQGIGDTILFSRFLPWLKEQVGATGKIYLCCAHDVMVLFWEFYLDGILEFCPEDVPIPQCDYSVVIGSLPHHSRTTLETLPADPGLIRKRVDTQMRIGPATIAKPLGPAPYKVGIVWSGNPAQERNEERSIPLELMLTLAEHPNVWLYSLQVGKAQGDIKRLGAEDIVCDIGSQLKERGLAVAGSAILQMDLLVTCCTSMAHLAGALGVEAWVVLCREPFWLWMHDRPDSPWWPKLRLFRQKRTNDWKTVMRTVRDELIDRVDATRSTVVNLLPTSETANG